MLRHPFPPFTVDSVDRSKEPDLPVPKAPPPVRVSYRRDGDLKPIVDAIKKHPRVTIAAAVGSGKSTRIPIALSEELGMLVVHTIPARHSTRILARYLGTQDNGDRFTFMDDPEADLPQRGVALMTNSYLVSRLCSDRFGECAKFLLYMDESHESDCATAVMRKMGSSLSCVEYMVFATATSEPGMDLSVHMPGKRKVVTYKRTDTSTWSATDVGKPWSVSNIETNTIIFLERQSTVKKMMSEYKEHGLQVFALSPRSTDEEFDQGLAALMDKRGAVTVLFLDYTCRSSLTLRGVWNAIESGEVALASVEGGAPVYKYRQAFDFETQQALARIGRCDDHDVTLYKPDDRPKTKMCDLEFLEGDAANLLYRMLGFRPPHECGIFGEAVGPVPKDLVGALQGGVPLQLYPPESREPWVVDRPPAIVKTKAVDVYTFRPVQGVGPRPVSCRTEVENGHPRSPSPLFDRLNSVEEVDAESLRDYADNRAASPFVSPVRTLSSRSMDNLSIFADESFPIYAKPRRIAKRVLDARMAEEKQLPAVPVVAESPVTPVKVDLGSLAGERSNETVSSAVQLADKVLEVRGQANKAFDEMARNATQVKRSARVNAFSAEAEPSVATRELLGRSRARIKECEIPESDLGNYFYYHGIDAAPNESEYFLRGYDSVVNFCEDDAGKRNARVLPYRDRLYAVKVVLDRYNQATAKVYGIHRVMSEIQARPKEDFVDLLRPDAFRDTLEWAARERGKAKSDILMARSVLPFFLDRSLDKMNILQDLEHSVMREVIKKFEYASVVKDPDKMEAYFDQLNGQEIADMRMSTVRRY